MSLFLDKRAEFDRAVAREAAHGAVAEHFGMRVQGVDLDWRGFPVCRYSGDLRDDEEPLQVNLLIMVAGFVGERLRDGRGWATSVEDLSAWIDSIEFDPNDRPDSFFESDLVLALQAVGNDLVRLNECECQVHTLLVKEKAVEARWEDLMRSLQKLAEE